MIQSENKSGWEEVDKALDECLTAIIACCKEAGKAREQAGIAQLQAGEARYWADKVKAKSILFQEGAL